MAKSKVEIPKELKDDLKKYAQNVAKYTATAIRDEVAEEFRFVIERFYDDYDPKYYIRQNGLYRTYSKYYKNSHGSVYYGGIMVSTENMYPGNVTGAGSKYEYGYRGTQEQVLESFYNGFHGVPTLGILSTPSPREHMENYIITLANNISYYNEKAIEKAKKETYKYLQF